MCGIAGFIGRSKKPKLSYELMSSLFEYLEIRGTDAAGVWATETGDGRVFYHKEPIRSSDFIKKPFWQKLGKIKLNMLLAHARATSTGNGHASVNSNNHPFVSQDKRIAMVHNGTLSEFQYLKDRYQILSETDSEVLLRMYEHGLGDTPDDEEPEDRLKGIKDIWSYISEGAMAVAVGERPHPNIRYLFLFHNAKRPLWVADLRKPLGQLFFFSSPDVWYQATSSSTQLKRSCASIPDLIEIPVSQVWVLWLDGDNPMLLDADQVFKYDLEIKASNEAWEVGELIPVREPVMELEVITDLDAEENVAANNGWKQEKKCEKDGTRTATLSMETEDWQNHWSVNQPPVNGTDHVDLCSQITDLARSVETKASNLVMEGTISASEYQELLDSLDQTKFDLEGTLRLLGG